MQNLEVFAYICTIPRGIIDELHFYAKGVPVKNEPSLTRIQRRQMALKPHGIAAQAIVYNVPFMKLSELVSALWRLETVLRDTIGAQAKIEAALAACVLHLADYCNAKGVDLFKLTTNALDRIEEMERKDAN